MQTKQLIHDVLSSLLYLFAFVENDSVIIFSIISNSDGISALWKKLVGY